MISSPAAGRSSSPGVTVVGLVALPGAAGDRQPAQGDGRRQHHRPRLGRGPARAEQPAAALVDGLFVLTVVFAGVYLASTRAWAATPAR